MIVVGILLGLIMLFRYQDPIYTLVVIWALIGIYAKRIQDDSTIDRSLEITALLGIIGLGMIILIRMFQKRIYFY